MSLVLDPHTVLWYLANSAELSAIARIAIEDAVRGDQPVHVSAISIVETVYFVERNRLPAAALHRLRSALADPSAGLRVAPLDIAVAKTIEDIPRDLVPDMPDRIIAATSVDLNAPLVTRDPRLRSAGIKTIW